MIRKKKTKHFSAMFIYIISIFFILILETCHTHKKRLSKGEYEAIEFLLKNKIMNLKYPIAMRRVSELPLTPFVVTEAWYDAIKNGLATNLTRSDWKVLHPIVPFIPPELLLKLDFTEEMIEFFGGFEMNERHLSVIAEIIGGGDWGKKIYEDDQFIIKMGNIFCGLSCNELSKIQPSTLRELYKRNFFKNLNGCNIRKLNLLSERLQKYAVIGPPRTWKPETLESIEALLAGLNFHQLRQIRTKSLSKISPESIIKIPQGTLKKMRLKQLTLLPRSSLLALRRSTLDLRPLHSDSPTLKVFFPFILADFWTNLL